MGRFSEWMYESHAEPVHAFHHEGMFFMVYELPLSEGLNFDPNKQRQYKVCWQRNKLGHMQCAVVTADNPEKAANWVRQRWQIVKKSGETPDGKPIHEPVGNAHAGWANEKVNADIAKSKTLQALMGQKLKVTPIDHDSGPNDENLEQAVGGVRDLIDGHFHYHQMEDGSKMYMLNAKQINTVLKGILKGHIKPVQFRKGTEIYKILASLKQDKTLIDPAEDDRVNKELSAKFPRRRNDPYAAQRDEYRKLTNEIVKQNAQLLHEPLLRNLLKKIWEGDPAPKPTAAPAPASEPAAPEQMGQPGLEAGAERAPERPVQGTLPGMEEPEEQPQPRRRAPGAARRPRAAKEVPGQGTLF